MSKVKSSLLLFAAMLVSLFVIHFTTLEAKAHEYSDYGYTVISETSETIAPGVTHRTVYLRMNVDGQQMVAHGLIVETSNPEYKLEVRTNYIDNQCEYYGLQKLTEQLAAAQANHANETDYNVIGGVNGDYYEMSNGAPMNTFVMDGHIVNDIYHRVASASTDIYPHWYPYFAYTTSGTYYTLPSWQGNNWETEKSKIVDAIGGDPNLVYEVGTEKSSGKPQVDPIEYNYDNRADLNARTAVGVTAKNDVVLVVVDGKQLPYSRGASMGDLGIVMRDVFGCSNALNLDGGGSSTMVAKPEGENDLKILNKPCDGFERKTSTSLMIVSHYVDEGAFDRVALSTENVYVSPGSTVEIEAKGVTFGGNAAEIPSDAVWSLKSGSTAKGTVTKGKFVSDGSTGDAIIEVTQGGKSRGTITIHVVEPVNFSFSASKYAVPFGETIELGIKADDGNYHDIAVNPGALNVSVSDGVLGTVSGTRFTARQQTSDSNQLDGTLTAKYSHGEKTFTATATLTVGKGSEVIIDFDDKMATFTAGWSAGGDANEGFSIEVVDSTQGRVHSGNHALKVTVDWRNLADTYSGTGYFQPNIKITEKIDITGATGLGAWVWVPDENVQSQLRIRAIDGDNSAVIFKDPFTPDHSENYDEGFWYYLYLPLDDYSLNNSLYIGNTSAFINFYFVEYGGPTDVNDRIKSVNNILTFYVDDITVDYSSVVPDREAPVIGDVKLNGSTTMKRGEITASSSGVVSITTPVSDNVGVESVQAWVDGVSVDATIEGGSITVSGVNLAAGVHTVKLAATDAAGNTSTAIRQVSVTANADVPTVKLVPSAKNNELKTYNGNLFIGSVYYLDVVATDITAIDGIDMDLDLINNATWELDAADVDHSFTFTYTVDGADNIASIHIKRNETPCKLEGEQIIATIPVRTWESNYFTSEETAKTAWSNGYFAPVDVRVDIDKGAITYVEGKAPDTLAAFGGERIQIDTELYADHTVVKAADQSKTHWHIHSVGQEAMDIEAGCLTPGWTGRTICETCGSPVDWGTKVEPLGHKYQIDPGTELLKCTRCDEPGNGSFEYEDDVTGEFDNGVLKKGWLNDHYYLDGKKVDGFQFIEEKLYKFEENTCENRTPYTGEYTGETEGKIFYYEAGVKKTGWVEIEEGQHKYYDETDGRYTGYHEIEDKLYKFGNTGICEDKGGFTGEYTDETEEKTFYYEAGVKKTGWIEIETGRYKYYDGTDGRYTGYHEIEDKLYKFDNTGICEDTDGFTGTYNDLYYVEGTIYTGWVPDGRYYKEGKQLSDGLQEINGIYYMFVNGACQDQAPFTGKNTDENGDLYYLNGKLREGWDEADHYYKTGVMQTGYVSIADDNGLDKLYFFNEEGVCDGRTPFTGDYQDVYYENGTPGNGWAGNSYYMDGVRLKGYRKLDEDGKLYYFDDEGFCVDRNGFTGDYNNEGYIDGVKAYGWVLDSYYDEATGKYYGIKEIEDLLYDFGDQGICDGRTPFTGEHEGKGYIDGEQTFGWVGDKYFDEDEGKLEGFRQLPDGLWYMFGEDGVCANRLPYTGIQDEKQYFAGVVAEGWKEDEQRFYVEGMYVTGLHKLPDGFYYLFGEDGVCDGMTPYSGEYDGIAYVEGVIAQGWGEDNRYYVDGVYHTGYKTIDDVWYNFGENGVCERKKPYTGFFETEGVRHYAVSGVLETGWFQAGEDMYHADENGVLHSHVTVIDPRVKCTNDYRLQYICDDCGQTSESQTLWGEQHTWNESHVCTECGTTGMDIGKAELKIDGKYFIYTGDPGGVRAAHTVTYNGRQLNVRSDRMGLDGFSEYSNNTDIGVATLQIEGRGDYYGELVGTFIIVPANVSTVNGEQVNDSSLTMIWEPAPGADYYEIYSQNTDDSWTMVGYTEDTAYTVSGLKIGESYSFRLAGVADRGNESYYSTKWSEEVTGTVDHMWVSTLKKATCIEDGLETCVCSDCGEIIEAVIPATGHNVTVWETTIEATTSATGSRHGECTRCHEDIVEEIPKLPSSNSSSSSSTTSPDSGSTTTPTKPETIEPETTEPTTPEPTAPEESEEPAIPETRVEMKEEVVATVDETTGKASAEVTEEALDETIEEAIAAAEAAEEEVALVVSIPVKVAEGAKNVNVKLPAKSVKKLVEQKNAALEVKSDVGEVKLDNTALKTLAKVVDENSIIALKVENKVENAELPEAQAAKVAEILAELSNEGEDAEETEGELDVIDVSLLVNEKPVSSYGGGKIEVTVLAPAKVNISNVRVYYMDDNGKLERMRGATVVDGKVKFKTTHLSKYIISAKALTPEFDDVADDAYYYEAVLWAFQEDITKGVGDNLFAPGDTCTRAQFVTFLWRAAGKPAATLTESPFEDVVKGEIDEDYYSAILWAVEYGVTNGATDTTFEPESPVLRGQAVTLMQRYAMKAGVATATGAPSFNDVENDGAMAAYYDAIGWAAANGITNGIGDGGFGPMDACERGQMITFLHRLFTGTHA